MDDISALRRHFVQTKSIDRALAPIATQISHLIMVNETFESGENDSFPADLVSRSSSVRDSAAELVRVSRLMTLDTTDEVMKCDMTRASELLDVGADNLVTATHRVYVDNMSCDSRKHLIRAAKDLFEGTLKVLLVSDDTQVRKIVTSANEVLRQLKTMTAVRTIPQLVACFKDFTHALGRLIGLLDKRQHNLTNCHQREYLIVAMTTLKKCVPMLKGSLQTSVKYPKNAKVLATQEYSLGQVIESLTSIIDIVEGKKLLYEDTQLSTPGSFVIVINKLTNHLSEESRQKSTDGELSSLIEGAVSHSMAVAHLSTEHHRSVIRTNCQRVLRQLSRVTEQHKNVTSSPQFEQLLLDFGDACDGLIQELRDLERHTGAAVLHLAVEVFKETSEPLSRLLKAALSTSKRDEERSEVKRVNALCVDALIDAFQQHTELMCQVSRLVAAGAQQSKSVRTINGCVTQLEQLDPEVVPAILASRNHGDRVTLEDLRLLTKEWSCNLDTLVAAIDATIDTHSFIEVSAKQIRADVCELRTSVRHAASAETADTTRCMLGHARRLSHVASEIVKRNENPFRKRTLRNILRQFNKAIVDVKSAVTAHTASNADSDCQTLYDSSDHLVACADKMRKEVVGQTARHTQHLGQVPCLDFDLSEEEEEERGGPSRGRTPPKLIEGKQGGKKRKEVEMDADRGKKNADREMVNSYVPDFTSDKLTKFVGCLTTAAIASQRETVDRLCTDVLAMTNHITGVGGSVTDALRDSHRQGVLRCLMSEVTNLAPELLDSAARVVQGEVAQVEPLYVAAESWATKMTQTESLVDSHLTTWRTQADQLVDAVRGMDPGLLQSKMELLTDHQRFVHGLVETTLLLLERSSLDLTRSDAGVGRVFDSVYLAKQRRHLVTQVELFDRLTDTFLTVTDMLVDKNTVAETGQLEMTSREWAAAVFCLSARIDTLCRNACTDLNIRSPPGCSTESSALHQELDDFTHVTIRVKELVNSVLESRVSPDTVSELTVKIDQLDDLNVQMSDCVKLMTHVSSAPYQTTDKLYAPHTFRLLQWAWALKVHETYARIDDLTRDFTPTILDSSVEARTCFQRQLAAFCVHTLEAVRQSRDGDKSAEVERHLGDMTRIDSQLRSLMTDPGDSDAGLDSRHTRVVERQWAAKACALYACLRDTFEANSHIIQEAEKLLQCGRDKTQDRTQDRTRNSTGRNSGVLLEQAECSHDDQRLDLRDSDVQAGHSSTECCTQLTGSLLEFAGDLGMTSVMSNGGAMASSCHQSISRSKCVRPASCDQAESDDWMEITASMWITEDDCDRETVALSVGYCEAAETSSKATPGGHVLHHATSRLGVTENIATANCFSPCRIPADVNYCEDGDNAIVHVAKVISGQLGDMVEYMGGGDSSINSKSALIDTAKTVIHNGEELVKFAKIIARYCISESLSCDLLYCCDQVPLVMTQLHILAGVKMATTDNVTGERVVTQTAGLLVESINKMLRVAESACIKGLREPSIDAPADREAVTVAMRWKWRLDCHRRREASTSDTNDMGLRKMSQRTPPPALSQITPHS